MLYELDVRSICHNLLATLARRPEAYHRKVLAGANGRNDVASIHDRVVFKQPGWTSGLQYDALPAQEPARSFLRQRRHAGGRGRGRSGRTAATLLRGAYEARLRRNPNRIQVQLSRQGNAWATSAEDHQGHHARGRQLDAGNRLPDRRAAAGSVVPFRRRVQFRRPARRRRRSLLPRRRRQRLGHLARSSIWPTCSELGLVDEWLGIDVGWASRPARLWTYPVETVSQSEGGFELVHQSVVVHAALDRASPTPSGRWSVTMELAIDTQHGRTPPRAAHRGGGDIIVPPVDHRDIAVVRRGRHGAEASSQPFDDPPAGLPCQPTRPSTGHAALAQFGRFVAVLASCVVCRGRLIEHDARHVQAFAHVAADDQRLKACDGSCPARLRADDHQRKAEIVARSATYSSSAKGDNRPPAPSTSTTSLRAQPIVEPAAQQFRVEPAPSRCAARCGASGAANRCGQTWSSHPAVRRRPTAPAHRRSPVRSVYAGNRWPRACRRPRDSPGRPELGHERRDVGFADVGVGARDEQAADRFAASWRR